MSNKAPTRKNTCASSADDQNVEFVSLQFLQNVFQSRNTSEDTWPSDLFTKADKGYILSGVGVFECEHFISDLGPR